MNAETTTHAIADILKNVDLVDLADGILERMHLKRRRPARSALSAVGLIGLGAVGALAVVAFVPAVREALTEDPVRRLRDVVDDVIGATEDVALDAERAVKRKMHDAKETAKGTLKGRSNNSEKLEA